jgi:quercetin dioxygenase-like cupin family protein
MLSTRSFRWAVHAIVVVAGLATIALQAQTPAGQPPANPPLFTGTSTVMDGKDLSAARRRFEPGARTYWHSHDNGQLLYVESGRMWTQKRGQAKRDLGPGDSDYAGPNVVHWHGASPQSELIQVNVGFGGATKWLEAVPDADYKK